MGANGFQKGALSYFGHGPRAAEFAGQLRAAGVIALDDSDFELLAFACARHSDGLTRADITVQVCWDADRLDLGRVGVKPHPRYLCTPAAKTAPIIEWAFRRSLVDVNVAGVM